MHLTVGNRSPQRLKAARKADLLIRVLKNQLFLFMQCLLLLKIWKMFKWSALHDAFTSLASWMMKNLNLEPRSS